MHFAERLSSHFAAQVRYDAVIVACGEQSATFGIPGVLEHACFLKEIDDAVKLRNKIGQCFGAERGFSLLLHRMQRRGAVPCEVSTGA